MAQEQEILNRIKELDTKVDQHIQMIEPLLDALRTIQSIQKFLRWIGLPFTVILLPLWLWLRSF